MTALSEAPAASPRDAAPAARCRKRELSWFDALPGARRLGGRWGPIWGGTFLAAAAFGAYALIAAASGRGLVASGPNGPPSLDRWARMALTMSMLIPVGLLVWRANIMRPLRFRSALTQALGGAAAARALAAPMHGRSRRIARLALMVGALAGPWINYATVADPSSMSIAAFAAGPGAWFLVAGAVLFGLASYAVCHAIDVQHRLNTLIREALRPDPLDPEPVGVIGTLAYRAGAGWVTIIAMSMPIVSDGGGTALVPLVIGVCLGVWSFLAPLWPAHTQMAAAKRAELERTRTRMRACRDALLSDPDDLPPAAALPSLIALEQRLEAAPVWPVTVPMATSYAAYALVPVVAWFGSAIVDAIVGRLAD